MSTNDVPGAVPANADVLRMGCWAEHEDGSLIFVKSTEGNRVIYEMYDVSGPGPVIFFQDAMPEAGFKTKFSWDNTNPSKSFGLKWTWHDKTVFPWDRVIKQVRPGLQHASAADQLSAAGRVAKALGEAIDLKPLDPKQIAHMKDQLGPKGKHLLNKIQSAIDTLPPDEALSEIQGEIRKEIAGG